MCRIAISGSTDTSSSALTVSVRLFGSISQCGLTGLLGGDGKGGEHQGCRENAEGEHGWLLSETCSTG